MIGHYSGAGNTFLILDHRDPFFRSAKSLHYVLKKELTG